MLFLTLALSSLLIALIVVALKNHQQRRLQDLADRDQSLPPLALNADYDTESQPVPKETQLTGPQPTAPDAMPSVTVTTDVSEPDSVPNDVVATDVAESDAEVLSKDWKQLCREYRQAGQYELALQAAALAWPQSQSYEQAALTLRAAIKQNAHPADKTSDHWLLALHRAAAECSLLHDKLPDSLAAGRGPNSQGISREALSQINLPWQSIGANELKLLTKTDRKLMILAWGEPQNHISARHYFNSLQHS